MFTAALAKKAALGIAGSSVALYAYNQKKPSYLGARSSGLMVG